MAIETHRFGFEGPWLDLPFWPMLIGGAVLGAIIGSFIGTVAERWPQGRSIVSAPSACEGCGKKLGVGELIPMVSYLIQRGKCRACGTRIDRWQLIAEIGGALAGAWVLGFILPDASSPIHTVNVLCLLMMLWQLLLIGIMDARYFWLPWQLTALLAATGVLTRVPIVMLYQADFPGELPAFLAHWLGGAVLATAGLWLAAALYRSLRGREGLGAGDPWLLGAIALWAQGIWSLLVLLLAAMIGIIWAIGLKVSGKPIARDMPLPLGSCMALAAVVLLAAGDALLPLS